MRFSAVLTCWSVQAGLLAAASLASAAQDRRTVTEPHIPPVCTQVHARLQAPSGELAEADEDVCIRDTRAPISIDTGYDNPGPQSNRIPEFRDVRFRDVHVSGGGNISVDGQAASHRTQVQFDGVGLDDPAKYTFFAKNAVVSYGPGPVNFRLQGEDVAGFASAPGMGSDGHAGDPCAGRFVPFPR